MSEFKRQEYSLGDRLAGRDLHGLAKRIPDPVGDEKNCDHQKWRESGFWYECWENGRTWEDTSSMNTAFEDIGNTNIIKCSKCGYMRRY
jgi:hypothetical protein